MTLNTFIRRLKQDITNLTSQSKAGKKSRGAAASVDSQVGGLQVSTHPIVLPSTANDNPINDMAPNAWSNWAGNQSCVPARIFHPTTQEELFAIVQQAKEAKKKIRCAATGHTWSSSSVIQNDGYMVVVNDMKKIYPPLQIEGDLWTVELETGVLVKDLDDLLRAHDPPLALPSNVVLDSVRYGGILSLGCHGAATQTHTLPELVSEVKIIDAHGVLNTFSKEKDSQEFAAAVVNLGLLGIIYSYTLRVEPMFNLHMTDTYPPLSDYFASPKLGGPKIKAMVLGNQSTEIFYWPFNTSGLGASNDHIWIKQWQRSTLPVTILPEQEKFHQITQNLETTFGNKLYEFMAQNPSCTPFLDCLLFTVLKSDDEKVLEAPDAIHYQAGIDNVPCLDLEMGFKADENFENVVLAWNYVIDQMYIEAAHGNYPFNLTMEMRFVKASDMTLSNAYDEDPDAIFCMIELLSVINTKGFEAFSSKMAKYWMDEFQAKPHWAKMWEHVPGIVPYLRQKTGSRLDAFEVIRQKYDPECMFMNKTFAALLGH